MKYDLKQQLFFRFSLIALCLPLHFPHSRQQQKLIATVMKMIASTGPTAVITMIGVHQPITCIEREANLDLK